VGAAGAAFLIFLIYQVPFVKDRVEWRLDAASGIVRGWLRPGDSLPTPRATFAVVTPTSRAPTPTPQVSATPAPTATALPQSVSLTAPAWEKQDWNNCGPATLALALRMFGWEGDQFDISDLLKPDRGDKNVNIEELVYYVRNRAGWLNADFRVGGTIEGLKSFLAAGYPVVVEKGFILDENDGGGGWAGHYLLLTGYDDAEGVFLTQDSNKGPDRRVSYDELDEGWREFNRVFLYLYPPEAQAEIDGLLGPDADPDRNRERALDAAEAEVEADAQDPYAWFNLGSNLVYFERYGEAADAYDIALNLELPWRSPATSSVPLRLSTRGDSPSSWSWPTTPSSAPTRREPLCGAAGRHRLGDRFGAIEDFRAALGVNPNYRAQYALSFVRATP
jgi:tetratricopeptide (TPR) repeat protein